MVDHAPHPFGVTIFESHVYWTDWYNKSVYRAPMAKEMGIGVAAQEVRRGMRGALELRAVSKQRQPDHHVNPCQHENGGCTHLCLFRERSYVCTCPDKSDGRECKAEESTILPTFDNELPTETTPKDKSKREKSDETSAPPIIIIATCILTVILILVVIAILVLVLNSRRKKEDRTVSESSRSMLTFSNPNYNCADGQNNQGEASGSGSQKGWKKKFKYDKATVSTAWNGS